MIIWVHSKFSGYIWHETKTVQKKQNDLSGRVPVTTWLVSRSGTVIIILLGTTNNNENKLSLHIFQLN